MKAHFKFTSLALAASILLALTSLQCNHRNCEKLRDELTEQKHEWQKCTRDEECILVGGNRQDCTGILSCNFAVNRRHRLEAERRVASLPEDTVDCMVCNSPNCETGHLAMCEPISGSCMVVTELLTQDDRGTSTDGGSEPEPTAEPSTSERDTTGSGGADNFGGAVMGLGGYAGAP